jgi:hypothetical protein
VLSRIPVIALVNRELPEVDMEQLAESILKLQRSHRARSRATAELMRQALAHVGSGAAPSAAS